MRILQVLDYAPSFGGGIADHLLALGQRLRDRGDSMMIALPSRPAWVRRIEPVAPVIELRAIRRPIRSGFRRRLMRLCRENRCDLVHMQFSFAMPLAVSMGMRRWSIPTMHHWHNPPKALLRAAVSGAPRSLPAIARQRLTASMSRIPAALADRRAITMHVAVSEAIRDLLVAARWTTADRVEVLPNGIDSRPARLAAERRVGQGFEIGCVANFRPQKDHPTLLRAFSLLARERPGARLTLVGDGPTRPRMMALASALGVRHRVEFTGSVPNTELDFQGFDLFALATHYEGHPLTLLEAMANGLPVAATDVEGLSEVVSNGVEGWLVPPEDPTALSAAMLRLCDDPSSRLAMGEAGRSKVRDRFSLEHWSQELIRLYESTLDGRRRV